MSALSGVVQPGAAYLLTDGAVYAADGRVAAIGAKVFFLEPAHLAIGWSGYCATRDLIRGLKRRHARSQTEVMNALPKVVRETVSANPRHRGAEWGLNLLVALWADGPQLWAIHSDQVVFGPRYQPFTPVRLRSHLDIRPGTEAAIFGRPVALHDPASFNPSVDGLILLEHQRRDPWEDEDGARYQVGGFAQLTTVSAAGIETRVLRRWPDRVGRKIEPEPGVAGHIDYQHSPQGRAAGSFERQAELCSSAL